MSARRGACQQAGGTVPAARGSCQQVGERVSGSGELSAARGSVPAGRGACQHPLGRAPRGAGHVPRGAGRRPRAAGQPPRGAGQRPRAAGQRPRAAGRRARGAARCPEALGRSLRGAGGVAATASRLSEAAREGRGPHPTVLRRSSARSQHWRRSPMFGIPRQTSFVLHLRNRLACALSSRAGAHERRGDGSLRVAQSWHSLPAEVPSCTCTQPWLPCFHSLPSLLLLPQVVLSPRLGGRSPSPPSRSRRMTALLTSPSESSARAAALIA